MNLFAESEQAAIRRVQPLAVRMRPRSLDEFIGQGELVGEGRLLRRLILADRLSSAVFHGPAGCGKTTLAEVIAAQTHARFETLHAAEASVNDVRAVIESARARLTATARRTVLFLDEIHRFNRAQQDVLLRDVEEGVVVLIGATTENPFFSINGPLLSRSQLFEFDPLGAADLLVLLRRALADAERGLGGRGATCDDDALQLIAEVAEGDARRALTALEVAVISQEALADAPATTPDGGARVPTPPSTPRESTAAPRVHVTRAVAAESLQRRRTAYDRTGDQHYDITSAFIKSMRGSDPDAAVYWLARMIEGGEDPRFVARRIAICASEDVGNADARALVIAAAAAQVVELVGLPECSYALTQAAIYVACAPKSNAVAKAIAAARQDVADAPRQDVPEHLRDASYGGATRLGRGAGYRYPHDYPGGFVEQAYMPDPKVYYEPTAHGEEPRLAEALLRRAAQLKARGASRPPEAG